VNRYLVSGLLGRGEEKKTEVERQHATIKLSAREQMGEKKGIAAARAIPTLR
jgi:hypothetical protein